MEVRGAAEGEPRAEWRFEAQPKASRGLSKTRRQVLPLPTSPSPSIVSTTRLLDHGRLVHRHQRAQRTRSRHAEGSVAATTYCLVRPDTYRDSVELMRVAALIEKQPGVSRAALMMATPANRELL